MKALHSIAFYLSVIGGLNWGLIGLGNFFGSDWNVVQMILGGMPTLENIVYVLVGLSVIYLLINHKKDCRRCGSEMM